MEQWLSPNEQEVIMWALSRLFLDVDKGNVDSLPLGISSEDELKEILFELIDEVKVSK